MTTPLISRITSWFQRPATGAVWTVQLEDVSYQGHSDELHRYQVIWRKGPQQMIGIYAFPTPKPLAKVMILARADC
jgi:hypothetical protein